MCNLDVRIREREGDVFFFCARLYGDGERAEDLRRRSNGVRIRRFVGGDCSTVLAHTRFVFFTTACALWSVRSQHDADASRRNRRRCCLLSSRAFRAHSSSRRNTSSRRSVAASSVDAASARALAPAERTRESDASLPGSSFSPPGEKSTGLETCVFHPTRDGARTLASRAASGPSSRRTVSSKSRRTECTSSRRTTWPLQTAWMRVAAPSRGSIVARARGDSASMRSGGRTF